MRYLTVFVIFATLLLSESPAPAQSQNGAAEKAVSLRAQLSEVETKQAELQTRLQKLEEAMKPENIEQNLAGVGSTKPEDLREQRRRQLEIERNGVQKQLDLLATSHTRIETAIAQADVEAYRQSAAPVTPTVTTTATTVSPTNSDPTVAATTPTTRPHRVRKRKPRSRRH